MFTNRQAEVLAILINNPEKEYYLSELGHILEKHPGFFQKGINSLEKHKFITSRKKGNQRLFKINQRHALYHEIKKIIQKMCGAEGLVQQLVDGIKEIDLALMYGSYVTDKMHVNSDIDILLRTRILNVEHTLLPRIFQIEQKLLTGICQIEKKLCREINYRLYSKQEFLQKIKAGDPFLKEVLSKKYILLKGDV